MTAWFKRTQPKPQPVVSLQPRTSVETPTAFLARLKIECTPPCQDCYRPADFMVTIHLVDHCDRPAVEVFICAEHVPLPVVRRLVPGSSSWRLEAEIEGLEGMVNTMGGCLNSVAEADKLRRYR